MQDDTGEILARRCHLEHDALQNIKEALRVTLNWRAPAVGRSRKLTSLQFILRALQRHLERQLGLEETGGYLDAVGEEKPNLVSQTERLLSEHEQFRLSLVELLSTVEKLSPADEPRLEQLADEIQVLLLRLELHDLEEADLLQEALLQDEGGEG